MRKVIIIMALALSTNTISTNAQVPKIVISDSKGWHHIGKTTVNFQKEKDEIRIIGSNKFSAIKFKVEDASIYLISLKFYYPGGESQGYEVNMKMKKNEESRVVDWF